MSSFNRVTLLGNITHDIELRSVGDTNVTTLRLAMNERYRTSGGEDKEETTYTDVDVWGRTAEVAQKYLGKGSPVLIEGRLRMDNWEDKEGNKRSKLKVRCDNMTLLPRNGGGEGAPAGAKKVEDGSDIPF